MFFEKKLIRLLFYNKFPVTGCNDVVLIVFIASSIFHVASTKKFEISFVIPVVDCLLDGHKRAIIRDEQEG